jgi:hypothetical protein
MATATVARPARLAHAAPPEVASQLVGGEREGGDGIGSPPGLPAPYRAFDPFAAISCA